MLPRLWLLVGSDRQTDRPTMSLIELSWTAKNSIYYFHLYMKLEFYILFCRENDVCTLLLSRKPCTHTFLSQNWFTHIFFVTKMIYGHFFSAVKTIYAHLLSQKWYTRFLSRKFLHIEICHPESSHFSGLWLSLAEYESYSKLSSNSKPR